MARPRQPRPETISPRETAGIDEAGRGCLAGPVVAAAVILPACHGLAGLADSKTLSRRKREDLAPRIKKAALAWSLGVVWQRRIDEINILQATFEAMAMAAAHLKTRPARLLVDGNRTIPAHVMTRMGLPLHVTQEAIIAGDASVASISAASILAKCFRDNLMAAFGRKWPAYGFEQHMGYGTKSHYAALRRYGPTPLHRLTYRGVVQTPDLLAWAGGR